MGRNGNPYLPYRKPALSLPGINTRLRPFEGQPNFEIPKMENVDIQKARSNLYGRSKAEEITRSRINYYVSFDYSSCRYCSLCTCLDLWYDNPSGMAQHNFCSLFRNCCRLFWNSRFAYCDVGLSEILPP